MIVNTANHSLSTYLPEEPSRSRRINTGYDRNSGRSAVAILAFYDRPNLQWLV
jgi:hypothetical protein